MGMNNIYYRFLHLVEDGEYQTMPARLRMNVIANHGIDKIDFELISLAVSAVNGCGLCVTSHEKKLRSHDVSREAIQSAVRIAATVHAVAGDAGVRAEQAGRGRLGRARGLTINRPIPSLLADNEAPGYPGAFFFVMPERILSAGVVVVRRTEDGWRVLLLRVYNYWDFPKGVVEAGEDPLTAARREDAKKPRSTICDFHWGEDFIETAPYGATRRWRAISWREPHRDDLAARESRARQRRAPRMAMVRLRGRQRAVVQRLAEAVWCRC